MQQVRNEIPIYICKISEGYIYDNYFLKYMHGYAQCFKHVLILSGVAGRAGSTADPPKRSIPPY